MMICRKNNIMCNEAFARVDAEKKKETLLLAVRFWSLEGSGKAVLEKFYRQFFLNSHLASRLLLKRGLNGL